MKKAFKVSGIIGAILFGVLICISGCKKNDDIASGTIKDMIPHTI